MPDDNPQIQSLYELFGDPLANYKPAPKGPVPDVGELFLWSTVSHADAPSCLAPVKMPDVHLSQQVAWLHRQIALAHRRWERGNHYKRSSQARARKVPAKDTPERRAWLAEKQRAYMKRYRELRRLDKRRMRGGRLTEAESKALSEHNRRSKLLRKAKARKRRREIRRAYVDMLIRDRKRGDLKDPANHTFIVDTPVERKD